MIDGIKFRLARAQKSWRQRRGRRFLESARRNTFAIGLQHQTGVYVLPSDDLTVRPKLFLTGTRGDITFLERAIEVIRARGSALDGRLFVDVGANLGTTSLAALNVHGFGRVVAIEPHPENVRFLRATLALNDRHDVATLVEAAVSDEPGRAEFEPGRSFEEGYRSGTGGLVGRGVPKEQTISVRVVSLDELVDEGVIDPATVGLIWLDVQGQEGHVLRGATKLRGVPVVAAVRRRRIERFHGRQLFADQVKANFRTFVDLRVPRSPRWEAHHQSASEIDSVIDAPFSTDVLLLP